MSNLITYQKGLSYNKISSNRIKFPYHSKKLVSVSGPESKKRFIIFRQIAQLDNFHYSNFS